MPKSKPSDPHVVYWSHRGLSFMEGESPLTGIGTHYEIYDRERKTFISGVTEACVFPDKDTAETTAASHPQLHTMPVQKAKELF